MVKKKIGLATSKRRFGWGHGIDECMTEDSQALRALCLTLKSNLNSIMAPLPRDPC